jgi:hypothetical protein
MTSKHETAASCLWAACLCLIANAAPAADPTPIVSSSASPQTSPARCGRTPEWEATHRDWMIRDDQWCSVGVSFRYPGAGGDIKVVVRKTRSATAGLHDVASVDLPGNGGRTSPFTFIFPCPPAPARGLCMSYEPATHVGELSYDTLDLGVDARPPPPRSQSLASTATAPADTQPTENAGHDGTRSGARALTPVAYVDPPQPVRLSVDLRPAVEPPHVDAVPLAELRRRPRSR